MKTYIVILLSVVFYSCNTKGQENNNTKSMEKQTYNIQKTETEWLNELGAEKFRILRQKGTERPHTGEYNLHFEKGAYHCAACQAKLFESESKFKSDCGWPSFDEAIKGTIEYKNDTSLGMIRTEIVCANCGGHLGHVFDDGPTQTGQRYCVNSLSLDFNE